MTKQTLTASAVMARSGKTFFRAARLLPQEVRPQVIELYAFCRRVDDLSDEPGLPVAERRASLGALAAAFEQADERALHAAGWPFAPGGSRAEAARLLVLAALGDLDQRQPQSGDALLSYAFGVAGTVGVMMGEVLGAGEGGAAAAVALGLAMQLTNIARDIAEDYAENRIYLPLSWLTPEQVETAVRDAAAGRALSTEAHAAVRRLLALADVLYAEAMDGIWTLPWRVRWSIVAAATCYREIGVEVGKDIAGSLRRRVVIGPGRKLWLLARAGVCLFLPRFWRRPARRVRTGRHGATATLQANPREGLAP